MILVTGASGLVGSHVVIALLRNGHKNIRCIGRSAQSAQKLKAIARYYPDADLEAVDTIDWQFGSVTDPAFLETVFADVATVYHCAAEVSFHPSMHEQMFHTNVYGTACVVNAALTKKVAGFCHVSSIASIGGTGESALRNEDDEWDSGLYRSQYSWSKYYAEMEVWRGIAEGLPATIVNPSVIIGPGNWQQSSSTVFTNVWNGLRFYTDGGTGFVDVRDVADSMLALVAQKKWGERYILNAENANCFTLISEVSAALGKKFSLVNVPPFVASLAWRLDWLYSTITRSNPHFSKENKRLSYSHTSFSNQKICDTTGIHFIPLVESIGHTGSVFLQNLP